MSDLFKMKKSNQDKSGLAIAIEPTIKRSRAAELLDRTPRTLARYEAQGLLRPIKLNCRSVVYRVSEIQQLLNGNITSASVSAKSISAVG